MYTDLKRPGDTFVVVWGIHKRKYLHGSLVVHTSIHIALLWTAPELLRMHKPPLNGTKAGDVYSYAIILHEIVVQCAPYSMMAGRDPKCKY